MPFASLYPPKTDACMPETGLYLTALPIKALILKAQALKVIGITAWFVLFTFALPVFANTAAISANKLAEKHYRQALYHYFTDEKYAAMHILQGRELINAQEPINAQPQNKAQNQKQNPKEKPADKLEQGIKNQLFLARLYLQLNMPEQAQALLHDNQYLLTNIAYLQLAVSALDAQNLQPAQQALSKIKELPSALAATYLSSMQVAFHHNAKQLDEHSLYQTLLAKQQQGEEAFHKPADFDWFYVWVNQAIGLMQKSQFAKAQIQLAAIKNTLPKTIDYSEKNSDKTSKKHSELAETEFEFHLQTKALHDYLNILLARCYIGLTNYQAANQQLANVAKDSAFAQQGLYLYGLSFYKLNQLDKAEQAWNIVAQVFPALQQNWQKDNLLARAAMRSHNATEAYRHLTNAEAFYLAKLNSLSDFRLSINKDASSVMLRLDKLYTNTDPTYAHSIYESKKANLIWSHIALQTTEIAQTLQKRAELAQLKQQLAQQKNKINWLADTIALNKNRQKRVSALLADSAIKPQLAALKKRQNTLKKTIQSAKVNLSVNSAMNATDFLAQTLLLNTQQMAWKSKLTEGLQIVERIKNSRNTDEYSERLQRLAGVLFWQAKTTAPQVIWQHQLQLNQIEKELTQAQIQYQKLQGLMANNSGFNVLIKRHETQSLKLESLLNNAEKIEGTLTNQLLSQLNQLAEDHQQQLETQLRNTRQLMVHLLENRHEAD
ncbi:tetratricopeptide repeat protein [Catenovulum sediminis]|uniref:Uncharacterized protein n=1 Tax=Catenovulum sediminis TaxID=1740262 RepID=A0ABV1RLR2_9ALTE|nr:hypothetical protein [Catenovulum sediminis]